MDEPITAAALRQSLGSGQPPLLIDVRRQPTFLGAGDMIRGALRRDPAAIEQWKQALPAGRDVVVYCVHGHEVSQNAAKALGARFLEGGIEAWRAAGGELSRKPAGAELALDHPRAAQDRPHRLPLAGAPLRRPGGRVPLCAGGRTCDASRRSKTRSPSTSRRRVHARRRALQLRRLPEGLSPRRAGARRAGDDRARRRHRPPRARAAGRRPAGRLARPVAQLTATTMRCWSTAWWSTMRSTPGARTEKKKRTRGTRQRTSKFQRKRCASG